MDDTYLKPIGQVAVFYLPTAKLDGACYTALCEYFQHNHSGYTMHTGKIKGFWRADESFHLLAEDVTRFEVSFDGGDEVVSKFVNFLASLCSALEEQAIYLTMGYKSYLVTPMKSKEPARILVRFNTKWKDDPLHRQWRVLINGEEALAYGVNISTMSKTIEEEVNGEQKFHFEMFGYVHWHNGEAHIKGEE